MYLQLHQRYLKPKSSGGSTGGSNLQHELYGDFESRTLILRHSGVVFSLKLSRFLG